MKRGLAHSVFFGWLLMASMGYAQVPMAESLSWQRVPATISAAPRVSTPVVAPLSHSRSVIVQPAISWRPISPPVMAPVQLISNGQMVRPTYAAGAPTMMVWQPVSQGGAAVMQPVGQWQVVSLPGMPATATAISPWRPVSQQATMQPAAYWQPMTAANQVPRLGGQVVNSYPTSSVPGGGSAAPRVDPYYRGNGSSYGYSSVSRYRPILPLGSIPENYQVGQGMLGQPKIYVPGQPLRNFVRYLTP